AAQDDDAHEHAGRDRELVHRAPRCAFTLPYTSPCSPVGVLVHCHTSGKHDGSSHHASPRALAPSLVPTRAFGSGVHAGPVHRAPGDSHSAPQTTRSPDGVRLAPQTTSSRQALASGVII